MFNFFCYSPFEYWGAKRWIPSVSESILCFIFDRWMFSRKNIGWWVCGWFRSPKFCSDRVDQIIVNEVLQSITFLYNNLNEGCSDKTSTKLCGRFFSSHEELVRLEAHQIPNRFHISIFLHWVQSIFKEVSHVNGLCVIKKTQKHVVQILTSGNL